MKKTLLVFVLIFSNLVLAQDKKKEDSDKKEEKTITDLTESSAKIEGLFTIYQDTLTGDVKMVLKEDQLNKDFIYFAQIAD